MPKSMYLLFAGLAGIILLWGMSQTSEAGGVKRTDDESRVKIIRWEYCSIEPVNSRSMSAGKATEVVTINYARLDGNHTEQIALTANDNPGSAVKLEASVIGKTIAKLGNDGWEMVSQGYVLNSGAGDRKTLYFKRPAK